MRRMMLGIVMVLVLVAGVSADDGLEKRFSNPPDGTKPRCYWYWLDGHITKEGITRDMEAMKRVGIGEGYIGIINGQSGSAPNPDLKSLSDEWWGYIEHAIREGGRIGVDVGLFNCPGWSQSGGPWIKPGQAMRYVAMQEVRVAGGKHYEGKLPQPNGDFQDLAVLAFPAPAHDADDAAARGAKITREPKSVTLEFAAPFEARSLVVYPSRDVRVEAELQVSDDGQQFKPLRKFAIDRHNLSVNVGPVPLAPIAISFPAVSARYFKLVFSGQCEMGNVVLSSAARLESYSEKQLAKVFQDPLPPPDFYSWQTQAEPDSKDLVIKPDAVRDISKNMASDGTLNWDPPSLGSYGVASPPAGDWIVLRTVLMPTGTKNSPAPSDATGLEVDKMNREALKSHFNAYVGKLLARMPAKDRKAWKHVVADSYEMGPQNWTDGMAADFKKCYGYDPLPYLPVLTGRIVGSAEQSDRFLWDIRRMVADRVSRDYVGGLRDLCRENGLKMWLENYGHWGFPGEFLQYGGNCDEISGEFWVGGSLGSIELRDAASAAHTYGKPVVFAEAFTGGPAFESTPASLKARGDWSFSEGINQFVLHVYIQQPWEDKRPGVNAGFGTEFNRHNTWFEYSVAWIDYLRRCSVMLQAGKHVADVAYYIGEDTPKMAGARKPDLPAGYNFDYINAEVIEQSLKVKKGRFVLPDGMSYSLLVLPEKASMRPAVLKKIRDLVKDGGQVLGPMPARSPSLANYPACDSEVAGMAGELWGKGLVLTNTDLKSAFAKLSIEPDVTCPGDVLWTHRRDGDTEIYFLSNQRGDARTEQIGFRVDGRAPEFWWPETGRMERPAVYEAGKNLVRVPVHFGPNTSVFVVFREKARKDSIVAATVDGKSVLEVQPLSQNGQQPEIKGLPADLTFVADGKLNLLAYRPGVYEWKTAAGVTQKREVASVPAPVTMAGAWEVSFKQNSEARSQKAESGEEKGIIFDKLEDWSKRPEEAIKYYSGTAVYRKVFDLSKMPIADLRLPNDKSASGKSSIINQKSKIFLDLGDVRDIARVRINGKDAGTVWKQPYRLDVTGLVKDGENKLEIDVVNTWFNRLVGDAQPGVVNKVTFTTHGHGNAKSPLKPAGLIGPVTLQAAVVVE